MLREGQPIIVKQTFDSPIDRVWSAITAHREMMDWFFPNIPAFEPVVGFSTQFTVQVENRAFIHVWQVTEVSPEKSISYAWEYNGYAGKARLTWELEHAKAQTMLTVTFQVLEDFPQHVPEFTRESCAAGWDYFIHQRLKDYLESNSSGA